MPNTKTATLTLEVGHSAVRVKLERTGADTVRVLEYYRRAKGKSRFQRRPREEGRAYHFANLGFDCSIDEAFTPPKRG